MWEMAGATAALPHAPESLAVESFRITLRRYQELNTLRADLEARSGSLDLAANADFAHLKTLPGIGSVLAMTILAEGGDLRRFGHHRQFLKYCGFDLAKSQSGTQRGREQLSKRGQRPAAAGLLAGRGRRRAHARELVSREVRTLYSSRPR